MEEFKVDDSQAWYTDRAPEKQGWASDPGAIKAISTLHLSHGQLLGLQNLLALEPANHPVKMLGSYFFDL